MLQYNASDIIKRAQQLADIENSSFISEEENYMLLNETWTMLYQKLINSGDKTFIRLINCNDNMVLPEDLYQISSIYLKHAREMLPKINSTQTMGYDIVGNTLQLSDCYKGKDIVMEYYPVPQTIELPTEQTITDEETGEESTVSTPATELTLPNNLFYVLIAYRLAIAYKAKQGADNSQLAGLYNQAENQFFDSINKDFNAQYTIKNVYKNNRRWW